MAPLTLQDPKKKQAPAADVIPSLLLRLGLLVAFDAFIAYLLNNFFRLGYYPFSAALIVVTIFVNIVLIFKQMYPIRWMTIGIAFMIIFTIYPIVFTVWVAFTNYGDGHLLTQEVAVQQILTQKYLPEEGKAYKWTAYKNDAGEYVLWLIDTDGNGYLAKVGEPLTQPQPGQDGIGELDSKGFPDTIEGYKKLNAILAAADKTLPDILFGDPAKTIQIRSPSEAAELTSLYVYDEAQDVMISNADGTIFRNVDGTFTSQTGQKITPGFISTIGTTNFKNFFVSPALRGPLLLILGWNFGFAFLTVLTTFSLGLAIAIMFNDPDFPLKKVIRSFLLIPYTIPALITILIWRGMMNPEVGVINRTLVEWFNFSPPWFSHPTWAKVAILIVNLWLGYPYFMLICSGALQSIPQDIYQAAEVDGATPWQRFWNITLPLLLVAVGPLLLASFTFNFNNFNLIYLFIGGGPPIAGASTTAGHTDILISYVYNLAFAGGRGVNYGFASAITIVIFFIVGSITLFQFRFTKMWEEVGENV
ncbi:MAG: ABC transporter permease subunit [Anaerolineales bacterium]|nr:ABC transporter permease subunit [Anaerolineales bacterium]